MLLGGTLRTPPWSIMLIYSLLILNAQVSKGNFGTAYFGAAYCGTITSGLLLGFGVLNHFG